MKAKLIDLFIDLILFSGIPLVKASQTESAKKFIGNEFSELVSKNDFLLICIIIGIFILRKIVNLREGSQGKETVDEFSKIISGVFADIMSEYSQKISGISSSQVPAFRINIMIKTKKSIFNIEGMKIFYFSSSLNTIHFTEDELDYIWKKKDGACGTAWSNRRVCIFDKKNKKFKDSAKILKSDLKFAEKIGSVISIPIWSKNGDRPVYGILNIDSTFPIEKTLFDRECIIDIFSKHVDRLSLILDKLKIGVKL